MMKMLKVALVPVGKAALAAVGFGISVYVGRTLGSEAFGVYAAGTTMVVVFAGIIQHVADAAYLRAIDLMDADQEHVAIRANIALRVLGVVGSIGLILLGYAVAQSGGFELPFSGLMIAMICAGVAATVLMSIPQIIHQSRQHYGRYLVLDMAMYGLRVSGLVALTLAGKFTTLLAFVVQAAAPALSIFGSPARLGPAATRAQIRAAMGHMVRLGGWIGLAFVFSIVTGKLDLLMLAFLGSTKDAGLYAAAINLAIIAEFAGAFLLVVYYPNILRWYREGTLRRVLLQFLAAAVPLACVIGWVGVSNAQPIMETVFGTEFSASGPIFAVLLPLTLFMLTVQPVAAPFINLRAPHILCIIEGVGLIAIIAALLIFIPSHGAMGAAWSMFAIRGSVGLAILGWALFSARPDTETTIAATPELKTEAQI
ncbi:MAG: hypothetical protein ABJD13_03150 [Paracoccaceae bacterium]